MGFALFFLAEYSSMILMSSLASVVFLGGWISWSWLLTDIYIAPIVFGIKCSLVLFFYIWVRASFPRYRIDQLMRLCWKIFLPISLAFVIFTIDILFFFDVIL
jgi:NADH-quinone oxidoreductase subunit H